MGNKIQEFIIEALALTISILIFILIGWIIYEINQPVESYHLSECKVITNKEGEQIYLKGDKQTACIKRSPF